MDDLNRCREQLNRKEHGMIDFLKRLIRTPSLSGDEKRVAELVAAEMKDLGYSAKFDEMGSILGRKGRKEGKTVLFDAHLDHIGEGSLDSWSHDPYAADIADGVLFGRGAVDMKGSLAAMIYGCSIPETSGEVLVSCVVHEETNEGVAIKKLIEDRGLEVDACVLGEPTDLDLSIGQRGRCVFRVTTFGSTSHASMPELGVNALYRMVPIIERIRMEITHLPSNPFLGTGSMAVTSIVAHPGAGPIVPDKCEILVDRRLTPSETFEQVLQGMRALVPEAKVEPVEDEVRCYTGYRLRVPQYFPGWVMDKEQRIVIDSLSALEAALGRRPRIVGWKFSTDGVATAGALRIPTVGFGPGDPSLAHQPDERIKVSDVIKAATGFCFLADKLASG